MAATGTESVTTPATANGLTPAHNRIVWLLLVAAFVAILNETTMGIAIPDVMESFDVSAVAAQWLTTAFMLTMAVVIPITGFLMRRFTTRQIFLAAMSLFSLGTLAAFMSPSFEVLVAARVVQASGTAIMMPLLMTTLMTVVPPHQRGRMMGRVSIVMSLAPAIGPTASGFIIGSVGWHWNFGIVLPIALVSLAMGARWLTNLGGTESVRIDLPSVVLSAFGFGGIVFGLSQIGGGHGGDGAESTGTSPVALVVALVVGVVALFIFGWRQMRLQRGGTPLLDLRVFRSVNFSLSVAQLGVMSMAFFGAITLLPLYLQDGHGLSAAATGLIVLPGSLAMGFAGPVIGRIYDRWGTRVLLVPGAVLTSGMLWMYAIFASSETPIWLLLIIQTLLSLGLAMSFTPLFTASLGALPPHQYSYGSAVITTVQQVAGAAGVAVLITVFAAISASVAGPDAAAAASGARGAFMIAAIVSLLLIVGGFLIRKPVDPAGEPVPMGH